jgi:hypothetical protein
VGIFAQALSQQPQEFSIVGAERIDDLPQLFHVVAVSRHS